MAAEAEANAQDERDLPTEITDADLNVVVGGATDLVNMLQMISTVLKDLHDTRSAIIRNTAG